VGPGLVLLIEMAKDIAVAIARVIADEVGRVEVEEAA
jgi:hypothetical protein